MAIQSSEFDDDELDMDSYWRVCESGEGLVVSKETYWDTYYDCSDVVYEWNNGRLESRPVSTFATIRVIQEFHTVLSRFLEVRPIAEVLLLGFGFEMTLPHKTVIRRPDLAIRLNSNLVALNPRDTWFRGTYDICIEALSDITPEAKKRDTVVKKAEYAQAGVKEYFILHRTLENMFFYRLNDQGMYEPIPLIDGDIVRSEVLPGFQFRVSHLLNPPSWAEWTRDEVYQEVVSLTYQAIERAKAKRRREQAEQRAEQEQKEREQAEQRAKQEQKEREQAEQRAKQAEQENARLWAKFKALGLSLDDL